MISVARQHEPSLAEARAQASVALAWLGGELVAHVDHPVTYAGPPVTFIVTGHPPPTATAVMDVLEPSFRVLERMARGKIRVESHWGATVHRDREGAAALRDGRSHLAPIYSGWDSRAYKLVQVLQLPGLFDDSETATLIAEELYDRFFRADVERQGILLGRMKASGAYHLFSRHPIRSLADIRGLRIGTTEGIEAEVVRALGAHPVALSSLAMQPALADDRIDAMHLSDGSAEVFGIDRIAHYRTRLGLVRQSLEFGMSRSFWSALTVDLRRIVDAWLRAEAQAETQVFYGVAGARARERFAAAGMELVTLGTADGERLVELTRGVRERFVRSEECAGRPARALVESIERHKAQHRGKTPNDMMWEAIRTPVRGINQPS